VLDEGASVTTNSTLAKLTFVPVFVLVYVHHSSLSLSLPLLSTFCNKRWTLSKFDINFTVLHITSPSYQHGGIMKM